MHTVRLLFTLNTTYTVHPVYILHIESGHVWLWLGLLLIIREANKSVLAKYKRT